MTTLVWLYQDLRLVDHAALQAAAALGPVALVYVLDEENPWAPQGAGRWWLHQSLSALAKVLAAGGGQLILRRGPLVRSLVALAEELGASGVFFSRAYEPWLAQQQKALHDHLQERSIVAKRFAGALLWEPDALLNQQGKPFQVFTPFYRHCLHNSPSAFVKPKALKLKQFAKPVASDELASWQLLPQPPLPNWAAAFPDYWQPGEEGAQLALDEAISQVVAAYGQQRDFPAQAGTSTLSPYLHFGEISPREVWRQTQAAFAKEPAQAQPFLRQLVWREFSYYLLHHWPHIPSQPFKAQFAQFPWKQDASALAAWQAGRTGYPIVDAGMRELWHSGWMHNRVRMIVASFLTKHLGIHWREGAAWFWDTLVDADLANNVAGWQWVAGSGADAAPYFRIFNPVLQSEKFDGQGDYLRHWLPELARLPNRYLHAPWLAPVAVLAEAGVTLGLTYPQPMVDHNQARDWALAAYASIKASGD